MQDISQKNIDESKGAQTDGPSGHGLLKSKAVGSYRILVQKPVLGDSKPIPIREALARVRNVPLNFNRVLDDPRTFDTKGVGYYDKSDNFVLLNPTELLDELCGVGLGPDDQLIVFVLTRREDIVILSDVLDAYYRAIAGRKTYDADEFVQLCFVSQNSEDSSRLDVAQRVRQWLKRNSKPFSKDEFLGLFPIPSSRWHHIKAVKARMKVVVRYKKPETQKPDPIDLTPPATSVDTSKLVELLRHDLYEKASEAWQTGICGNTDAIETVWMAQTWDELCAVSILLSDAWPQDSQFKTDFTEYMVRMATSKALCTKLVSKISKKMCAHAHIELPATELKANATKLIRDAREVMHHE